MDRDAEREAFEVEYARESRRRIDAQMTSALSDVINSDMNAERDQVTRETFGHIWNDAIAAAKEDRRFKIVYATHEAVLAAFGMTEPWQHNPSRLPDGAKAQYAFYVPERNSFAWVVSHPSFDPVPEGCIIPEWTGA